MRETRNAQGSILDFYTEHEYAQKLRRLSELLDKHPIILSLVERDFDKKEIASTGAWGLSLESILRCLLLKQILRVSYRQLSVQFVGFAQLPCFCPTALWAIPWQVCVASERSKNQCRDAGSDQPSADTALVARADVVDGFLAY